MKTYNEMADDVFRIGDERIKKSKARKKKTAAVLSVAVVAVIAVTVWQSRLPKAKPIAVSQDNKTTSVQQTTTAQETTESFAEEAPSAPKAGGQVIATPKTEESADGGVYGGESSGGWAIPCFPMTEGIEYSGEKLTDTDAKEYFAQNGASIISALSSSGVETGSVFITEKGYCHVSYDGAEGKPLTVKQDFRDYLVYNGDKIIAIITLYKQDGKIYNSPAFGAPWFENYAKYLNQHKGEELVYVYAGWMEIIVAPDGSCCNPMGHDCSEYVGYVKNLYNRLYCPEIVYVP